MHFILLRVVVLLSGKKKEEEKRTPFNVEIEESPVIISYDLQPRVRGRFSLSLFLPMVQRFVLDWPQPAALQKRNMNCDM